MKKIFILTCLLLGVSLFSGCKDDGLIKIKVAEVTHSIFYAPQYVAMSNGYFEEEGLKVELINSGGADKVTASLLSKDVQIGLQGSESSIYVYNNGQKDYFVNFMQLTKKDGSFIMGRENIAEFTLDHLKNKTILGGRVGGMPLMSLEYVLKNHGFDVRRNSSEGDVNVRTDIQFTAQAGAFANGTGDFTTLFEPTATLFEKEKKGYVLQSVGALSGELPYTCYTVTKSYLDKNKDILIKFSRAIKKGLDYVINNSDSDIASKLESHFVDIDVKDIEVIVKRYREIDCWSSDLMFKEDHYNKLLDIIELSGELEKRPDFEILVTNKILEKI